MTDTRFPILGVEYIEFYVGSAKQTAYMLKRSFGFQEVAYSGIETGRTDGVSHVLTSGEAHFVISGSLSPHSRIARHVAEHGDSVRDIALRVPNVRHALSVARARGAIMIQDATVMKDEHGSVVVGKIGTYGDTVHTLIERVDYTGPFLPGFRGVTEERSNPIGLIAVDHIVGNVELGKMNQWADYYARVMGFTNRQSFSDKDISTKYTALMSKVMEDGAGKVKFPINEPAGQEKSHVDEYLDFNRGPGVQHIAMETKDIVATVCALQAHGVEFSPIPQAYYDILRTRFADIDTVDIDMLAELGILADRDEDGYLLQIFTKHVVDRPTLFFEIIERQGSRGFGIRNFQALFEAKELERTQRTK